MRSTAPLTVFGLLVFLGLILRHHIRDLSEIVRTYSTFYPYLSDHPSTLHRYEPPSASSSPSPSADAVPRNMHQIFLTEGRVSTFHKYAPAVESCRTMHPEWNHTMWTDEMAKAFMQEHYPAIYPHYLGYRQSIQRANILRYAVLDHYGGVYLDVDVTCLQPLDSLRDLPWLTPGAHPAGVNNAFILARPHHPFLQHLLSAVPSRDLFWKLPYVENMLSTGCMFFSNRWQSYARTITPQTPAEDRIYILADEQGDLASHMLRGIVTTPLFKHGGASSWHSWDAAAIVAVGKYWKGLALLLGVVMVATIVGAAYSATHGPRRRRGSWGLLNRTRRSWSPEDGSSRRPSREGSQEKLRLG